MAVRVAEYLGQFVLGNQKHAVAAKGTSKARIPSCPFLGSKCTKLTSADKKPPVCSVALSDGRIYIVCQDRLIPARASSLSIDTLLLLRDLAGVLFPWPRPPAENEVGFRRQVGLKTGKAGSRVSIDYVLRDFRDQSRPSGVILEVQGGGETSNTGTITRHVRQWENNKNVALDQPVLGPNPILNNAWKRQLEQLLRKAAIAREHDGATALALGSVMFEYVMKQIQVTADDIARLHWRQGWEVAFIELAEKQPAQPQRFLSFAPGRSFFLGMSEFVHRLVNCPAGTSHNPFTGEFTTLDSDTVTLE